MNSNNTNSDLINELGIADISKDLQSEIITKLGENALKNAMLEVVDKLTEKNLEEFEEISKSGDMDKIRYFLQKNIPGFDSIVNDEVKKVIADFKRIKAGMS